MGDSLSSHRAVRVGATLRDEASGSSYRVLRHIGRGGYSEVFEVVEERTSARHAMKCLRFVRADDPRSMERARREARVLARLAHPCVVRVHAQGLREDGLFWVVMDLLEGHTLRALLEQLGRLPVRRALEIAIDVCDGLEAIHQHAVHRDLKPENVHVGEGRAVLFDLGVGKFHDEELLTTGDVSLGTMHYMSPEQLADPGDVDARSDLFAVGVVLFEMLAGAHPFADGGRLPRDRMELGNRILFGDHAELSAAAPGLSAAVVDIVERALCKPREERFESAAGMSAALTLALEAEVRARSPEDEAESETLLWFPALAAGADREPGAAPGDVVRASPAAPRSARAGHIAAAIAAMVVATSGLVVWAKTRAAAPGDPSAAETAPDEPRDETTSSAAPAEDVTTAPPSPSGATRESGAEAGDGEASATTRPAITSAPDMKARPANRNDPPAPAKRATNVATPQPVPTTSDVF